MKSLVKISMAVLVLLFTAASATAQAPRGERMTPDQRAAKITQRMIEQLSLSKEQAARIEKIYLGHFKNMPQHPSTGQKALRPGDGKPSGERPAPGVRSERMAKLDSQIREVLNAEQYKKWCDQRAEMQKKMQERRAAHGRPGQPKAE